MTKIIALFLLLAILIPSVSHGASQEILGGPGVLWGTEKGKINANFTELYGRYTNLQLDTALGLKEDSLGTPWADGQVLSSTAAGVRAWVDPSTNVDPYTIGSLARAGHAGGQTTYCGTDASDGCTWNSTSNATKGVQDFGGVMAIDEVTGTVTITGTMIIQ